MSNKIKYDLKPKINISSKNEIFVFEKKIKEIINNSKYKNIVIETYPGVDEKIVENIINKLNNKINIFHSDDYALKGTEFRDSISEDLTNDRVFGKITEKEYKDFFIKIPKILNEYKNIFYGVGSIYLTNEPDIVFYIDITRWEIQKRYREGKNVFFGKTLEKDKSENFKRGYFVEWRMADKIKRDIYKNIDFYIDGTCKELKGINGNIFRSSIEKVSKRPFRLVPYFDYGVWGGKWMEEKFDLGQNEFSNWAWGFDGVPEENSILINFGNGSIEIPAINLVFFQSINLLGKRVQEKFGDEFPIRFDFLDTIKGGNLSLQVHPDDKYIKDIFNMKYSQNESYYIIDVDEEDEPLCYLGVKDDIDPDEFIQGLKDAQKTNTINVDKYVNKFTVKKHDHIIHPSGVVHSAGRGCMILEISSTPYIFTFKLWDWGRLGLDGKPRPINIEHGKNVIDYSFKAKKTMEELVNNFKEIYNDKNLLIEKTGLHEKQFIETRRLTIKNKNYIFLNTNDSFNMLNLVEGESISVESIDGSFKPLIINYAETFIIPEFCKKVKIKKNKNDSKTIVIQAFVKK